MYTDRVNISTVTTNKNTGKKTRSEQTNIKARVESEDLRKKSLDGNIIVYSKLIILPPSINIKKEDEIQIIKIGGVTTTDEPKVIVEQVFKTARFAPHHIEVWCK